MMIIIIITITTNITTTIIIIIIITCGRGEQRLLPLGPPVVTVTPVSRQAQHKASPQHHRCSWRESKGRGKGEMRLVW
jgi:hypothetical protein